MEELLLRHIQRISHKIEALKVISQKISTWRFIVFFAGLALIFIRPYTFKITINILFLIAVVLFFYLVVRHAEIEKTIKKLGFLKDIKKEHLSRKNLDWEGIKEPDFKPDLNGHPFAKDLHCVGPKSLHKLIDTSIYENSSALLVEWLINIKPNERQLVKRSQLIKELSGKMLFRDKMRVAAKFVKSKEGGEMGNLKELINQLKKSGHNGFNFPLVVLSILAVSNIVLLAFTLMQNLSAIYFVLSLLAYLLVYKMNSQKASGLFDAAYQTDNLFTTLFPVLTVIENFKFRDKSGMAEFVSPFQTAQIKPSVYAKKAAKIAGKASLQTNQILWPLVNLLMPWDLYYAMKFEALKKEIAPKFEFWLDKLFELEALCSIANFAALNSDYTFPKIIADSEAEEIFIAKDLGHPLINADKKVTNNFTVDKNHNLFLITGSNMAGKSTFLRTVGINLVLAFAGAPVNASSLSTSIFRIYTGINITDSLGDGLSHFYAEVKKLKKLLDQLKTENQIPLFYFVDEIYKGTNNKERYLGSAAFLKEVARYSGVGIITTHDLELADMENEIPNLSNWHFTEDIKENRLSFDYKIRRGASPSTNALKIMKMEGLPT